MAWTIPKQTLAGQLSNSNLSGNIGIPKQLIAADLQHMTPVLVNGTITLPMPQIVTNLMKSLFFVGLHRAELGDSGYQETMAVLEEEIRQQY